MNGAFKTPSSPVASRNSGSTQPNPTSTDLWSGILDSVKGTRGGPASQGASNTKQCIVLGSRRSGKSTLIERIASTTGEPVPTREDGQGLDLGMSYSVIDIHDDMTASPTTGAAFGTAEEDTLARLSIYQLPSPQPPFPSLLPLALNKDTVSDSAIVIVLNWEKPWDWIRELKEWIRMLTELLSRDEGTSQMTEARERVESYLRNYREPSANVQTVASTTGSTSSATASSLDAESPLPHGTLLENLGLPIIVVGTKADHINALERSQEFTDEQFEYMQQTLRTICLRYGASLCFTSQTLPQSFSKLRQYILHRLFSSSRNTPTTSSAVDSTPSHLMNGTSSAPTLVTKSSSSRTSNTGSSFPFNHRANVIDRDQIFVPTGWDSWGKIRILREKYDCHEVGELWETSLSATTTSKNGAIQEGESQPEGLEREYAMIIVDFAAHDKPNKRPFSSSSTSVATQTISPQPEQSFLQAHYHSLQSDLEKDPRLAFRQQPHAPSSSSSTSLPRNGIVGPMSGLISDLPSVQGALERASSGGVSGATRSGQREGERTGAAVSSASRTSLSGNSMSRQSSASTNLPGRASQATSQTVPPPQSSANTAASSTSGTAAGGNQVLADFFQSLLTARSGGASSGNSTPASASGPTSTGRRAELPSSEPGREGNVEGAR